MNKITKFSRLYKRWYKTLVITKYVKCSRYFDCSIMIDSYKTKNVVSVYPSK